MAQRTRRFPLKETAFLGAGMLALLAAILYAAVSPSARPQDWRERAKPIASVWDWYPSVTHPFYHWLSDTELLYIEQTPTYGMLKKLHVPSGKVTEIGVLPAEFLLPTVAEMRVSPDGTYLLWVRDPATLRAGDAVAGVIPLSSLRSGGPYRTWQKGPNGRGDGQAFWFPDSRRWAYAVPQKGISVSERDQPELHTWRATPNREYFTMLGVGEEGAFLAHRKAYPPNASPRHAPTEIVRLTEPLSPDAPLRSERLSVLPRPEAVSRENILALSPDGKRLIGRDLYVFTPWELHVTSWLSRFSPRSRLPGSVPPGRIEDRLWVCDIRDGRKRVVARMPSARHEQFAAALRWTPDGKSVSFACGGELFVHPVPDSGRESPYP